ncbi:MATE family efflux transporter [Anaerovorax odorimutans]|uniref:Multidrug export protein MepA n=1 Tax=Anaerovorax odorimutans TaxID=109327 RepID=A0ABT1RKM7_9FIRM|nr:MATE family efflux transporter [Anaerovorax odorimutans]MCQ4635733.1 MATE family efflux transporter [Anaerovorax odorimutans]
MNIKLSDHFTYKRLLRFVAPSIAMMIFTSIYGIVDGLFVSNFAGKIPFAAINLIMPFIMVLGALGFMVGTGGSAIVAKTLGEGDEKRANDYFSMMVYVTIIGGILFAAAGFFLMRPISLFLGATDEMLDYCVLYGQITMISLPAYMLQNVFQSFFITAEKPHLGFIVTVACGLTNIVLDFLFIAGFGWGLVGAAVATAFSEFVGGIVPIVYFARKNNSILKLVGFKYNCRIFGKTCVNGSSELMSNISMSVVAMLYNFQLLRFAGENGVAAFGVMMYANFIFMAIFFGYSIGVAPLIGYNFGAENHSEQKNLFVKSMKFLGISGLLLAGLSIVLAGPLSSIFVGYDSELFELTRHGMRLYAVCFILVGFNVFASSYFTALNNGLISAVISFIRALIFKTAAVLILPMFWGLDGVWLSAIAAEILGIIMVAGFLAKYRKRYHYL